MTVLLDLRFRWRGLLGLAAGLFAWVGLPAVASARLPAPDYLAYVTDGSRGTRSLSPGPGLVAVIDPATRQVMARVPVGPRPDAVVVSPNGKRVYVAYSRSETISVIDTASDEVTATIRLKTEPRALAVSPDGRSLYVAVGDQVNVLDTSTDAVVTTIGFRRSPSALTFSPDGKRLYVASAGTPKFARGSLTAIEVADNSVLYTTSTYYGARAVAAPSDTKAYVLTEGEQNGIKVVDTVTGKLTGVIAGNYEEVDKMALSPDRSQAYVAGDNGLEVIDTATDSILRTVNFDSYIRSLAVSPNGDELYVILGRYDEIKVLDTASARVLGDIPAGGVPWGVAFSPVAAPRVVTEPTNQSLVYGDGAHLYAEATGDPKPAVQWQVSRDGADSWHDLVGATELRHPFVPSGAQTGNEYRAEFTNQSGSVATRPATLTVTRAVPTLEWQVPTPIEHGTPLSSAELDARASVPGTFDYTPPTGTVLAVGPRHRLSVTFNPQAGENYASVTTSVPIDMTTAPERPQPPPPPPPPGPVIPTPEPVGPTNPSPPARRAPAADDLAYVANPTQESVTVIDSATRQIVATVSVGLHPDLLAASPDGKQVFVADRSGRAIAVIDTANDETTPVVRTSQNPKALAVSPDGRTLYVTEGRYLMVVDITTGAVVNTIATGKGDPGLTSWALGLSFSPDGNRLYVAGSMNHGNPLGPWAWLGPPSEFIPYESGNMTTIDVADNSKVHALETDSAAYSVAAPTDAKAYVVTAGRVNIVNTVTNKITGVIAGDYKEGASIALSPDRARAYLASGGQLNVVDTVTDRILRTVDLGSSIKSLATSPDGYELYVTVKDSDEVEVLDTATGRVLAAIPAGRQPSAVAFGPAKLRVVTQPTNQFLIYGGQARLYARATGYPTPVVQWQSSRNGGGTWHDVAGATSPRDTFVPSRAQTGDVYRATFTNPSGSVTTRRATLTVVRAVPTLEWQVPTPIEHGTPLSSAELDARASVPGTFAYTPPAGTVLGVGAGQELSATFTPEAGENYASVTTAVPIDVTTTPEPPQPPPPLSPPAPVIPTPEPVGPTNPTSTPPGPTKPGAPQVCAPNSRLVVTVPRRLRSRATQITSAVVVDGHGHRVRRASYRGWRVTVSLNGLSGGSYSLRIVVRGPIHRSGANRSRPASRTLRAEIRGCQQSGSIQLIATGR